MQRLLWALKSFDAYKSDQSQSGTFSTFLQELLSGEVLKVF